MCVMLVMFVYVMCLICFELFMDVYCVVMCGYMFCYGCASAAFDAAAAAFRDGGVDVGVSVWCLICLLMFISV